ncbi:MAG: NADH-quinone oxidoreductase subunit C [Planctomycetota bacterium]|nr:MAG: NADH-quinone oxidoreductase subunit C [Planctomycetota bacterium]
MPALQRDTGWGPMQAYFEAARAAHAALSQAGFPVELHQPNLPVFAAEGEAKELAAAHKEGKHLWRGDAYVQLADRGRIVGLCRFLRDQLAYQQIIDVTAVDHAAEDKELWGMYAFLSLTTKLRLSVKTMIPKDDCRIDSIVPVYPGANWHERETAEFYGITYTGHPDPRHMLLPDDWVGNPLRKDYKFPEEYHGISCV